MACATRRWRPRQRACPIDYVDPTEGNFSLTESVAIVDKGESTNPLAMKMAQCIIENGRAELQENYPNPLYEGESADSANKSATPRPSRSR